MTDGVKKVRAIMNVVVEKATFQKLLILSKKFQTRSQNVFDRAFSELLQDWYDESSGVAKNYMCGDQSIVTLYNLKQQYEKRNLSLI